MIDSHSSAGPHAFRPLRWWDAHHAKGRCRHCFCSKDMHPIYTWVPSRPMHDKQYADPYRAFFGDDERA